MITKNGKTVELHILTTDFSLLSKAEALQRLRKLRNKLVTLNLAHSQIQEMKVQGRK